MAISWMKNSVKHIELLDYIRAIAIVAVLAFHALASTYGYEELPWDGWLRDFKVPASFILLLPCSFGGAGVALFFVVSGFCIHLSFTEHGQGWRSFWIRRFFRIYPAYLAAIVFAVVCTTADQGSDLRSAAIWRQILMHVFLVHNLDPTTFSGLNASLWSLAVEVQLYLLYPLLLVFVAKFGWQTTMTALAVCECLIRAAGGIVDTLDAYNTGLGRVAVILGQLPFGFWFSWTIGASVAESFLKKQQFTFAKVPLVPCLTLAVGCYFIKPAAPFMFFFAALTTAVAVSKILSGGRGIRIPALLSGSLNKIALWSYSIYLVHQPLLYIYSLVIGRLFPWANVYHITAFFLVVATFLIIIPIGALWHRVIELPGINFGKRLIQRRSTHPPEVVARTDAPEFSRSGAGLKFCALAIALAGSVFIGARSAPLNFDEELKVAVDDTLRHDLRDALKHYYRALEIDKNSPIALKDAAWVLATAPDPGLRDGKTAVTLAARACELTGYKDPVMLATLAAANAEAGDFQEAVTNAGKAQALAVAHGMTQFAVANGRLIKLYKAGKAFHETSEPGSD